MINILYDKILKKSNTGTVSLFNASTDADWDINDFFTDSNSF